MFKSVPTLEPVLEIELPKYITNNSVSINWEIDQTDCSKLNGYFLKYIIELKVNLYYLNILLYCIKIIFF